MNLPNELSRRAPPHENKGNQAYLASAKRKLSIFFS